MDSGNSGISVIESPPRGQEIPVFRESVTAFIGPAPRGPVDIPVAIRSLEEFLTRFGVSGYRSRMELLLQQYFENGGTLAIVVRVCRSGHRIRIALPAPSGALVLEALHPGPLEHLRASVDYDGISSDNTNRFNLVIHRCRSPQQLLVEEQERYIGVSVRADEPDFVGDALAGSELVRLAGEPPPERPTRTLGADAGSPVAYVYGRAGSQGDNTPTDYDLIGSREDGRGLFALDQVPWVDFVYLVPGATGASLGPVALFAAERFCRARHALLLLDPPANWKRVSDVVRVQRERGFASPNAISYFPPLESTENVAPAGALSAAGAIAGRLCAVGFDVPARMPLSLGRSRPAITLADGEIHQLGRLGVNALTRPTPARAELAGPVTMARFGGVATSWNSLRRRRTALFILSSISRHTRWAAFEPADAAVWEEIQQQVSEFLGGLHGRGALAGANQRDAFFVRCDSNTHNRGNPGSLVLVVGVALGRAGDFLAFRITQSTAGCDVEELSWQPGLALAG